MRLSAATPAQIEEEMAKRRANLPASDWRSTAPRDGVPTDTSLFAGVDLALMIRYMADSGDYTVDDLAYAVETRLASSLFPFLKQRSPSACPPLSASSSLAMKSCPACQL